MTRGRIEQVCGANEIPDGMLRAEASGGTLIPGLIDAHVHLDDWELPYYLAYGVTTVRDGNSLREFGTRTKTCADWKQERTVLDLVSR